MRSSVRFSLLALLVGMIVAVAAPGAQAAVEIEKFVGINCVEGQERCGEKTVGEDPISKFPLEETLEPTLEESEAQGFRQAAGHVPYGVTDFTLTHSGSIAEGNAVPNGVVTHVRVDVAAGLAAAPAAVPQCSVADFTGVEASPGTGFFTPPSCKEEGTGPHNIGPNSTVIGEEQATVYVAAAGRDVVLKGKLYNLEQPKGRSALYGAALEIPTAFTGGVAGLVAHTLVEGNVEWGKEAKGTNAGDYHDYFEVNVSPSLPVIRSRQLNYGTAGNGAFITNATKCPGDNTTYLTLEGVNIGSEAEVKARLESGQREVVRRPYTTLLGLNNCNLVPFLPSFALTPDTTKQDEGDGITTEIGIPRHPEDPIDSAQLKTATVTLPEGMTLNPSAAAGLAACTPAQARIHSDQKGTSCPAASEIGTVDLNVPTLPDGSFTGKIYLGGPESGPITGPPYDLYVDAESERYGVSVRLKGETNPNATTGRVTTVFDENPEQPFTNIALHFKGGDLAPIANPLACGTVSTERSFEPFTGTGAFSPAFRPFTVDSNGAGGSCASPVPFSPGQGSASSTPAAGGHTNYTFNLNRPSGQQYLSEVKTTLPPGLVGTIPAAKLCAEAEANAGSCSAESLIGSASAVAGAGTTPFTFLGGRVYLTGPYNGGPYGLSIVVPAIAGPFNLGNVVTRAKLEIDPTTARVTATSILPRVYKGIPLRLRDVSVSINKPGFLYNPTNCEALATNSTLVGYVPGSSDASTATLSSPFQVGNCSALKFTPAFKAKTSALTSKANGASLETTINEAPGQANIKSVRVQLPLQLPSRLTTLQKACSEAQFAADPFHCPSGSFVGGARANTPTLPGKLMGPAILVSHGGAAFPDLDLVLEANGVRTILVGNTDIKKGITTTTFASTPDVPVTSITVNLPLGSHSALAANGNLCASKLVMPTTITGQNATVVKQNTQIAVAGCGVRIVGHKVAGNTAFLTVQTYGAGRISGKGGGLATTFRRFSRAQKKATLKVPLSRSARGKRRPFKVRVRVGFVPKAKGGKSSSSTVTVSFR